MKRANAVFKFKAPADRTDALDLLDETESRIETMIRLRAVAEIAQDVEADIFERRGAVNVIGGATSEIERLSAFLVVLSEALR